MDFLSKINIILNAAEKQKGDKVWWELTESFRWANHGEHPGKELETHLDLFFVTVPVDRWEDYFRRTTSAQAATAECQEQHM